MNRENEKRHNEGLKITKKASNRPNELRIKNKYGKDKTPNYKLRIVLVDGCQYRMRGWVSIFALWDTYSGYQYYRSVRPT